MECIPSDKVDSGGYGGGHECPQCSLADACCCANYTGDGWVSMAVFLLFFLFHRKYQTGWNKPKTATRPFAPGVLAKAAFAERIEVIPTMISVD